MKSIKEIFSLRHMLFLPIVLYALGINPYLAPSTYDEVVYWEGAKSIAYHGSYIVNGDYIVNTPPGLSLLLTIPLLLGFSSVAVGKIVIIICAAISMFLVLKILESENFPHYLLAIFFFFIVPSSFLGGIRLMSEWPYVMWTMLFFYLIRNMQKSMFWVFGAGCVLTVAILTRYIGFTLYFPLAFLAFKNNPWRSVLKSREFFVFVISIVLLSFSWLSYIYEYHIVQNSVYYKGIENFNEPGLLMLVHMVSKLFLGSVVYHVLSIPLKYVCDLLIIVPMLLGWSFVIKRKSITYIDVYVAINLIIICFYVLGKDYRFLIPIAPFLFSYFFYGTEIIAKKIFSTKYCAILKNIWLTSLLSVFLALDLAIIFYGNGMTYGAAFYPISNTPDKYYKGYWRDLYLASQVIKNTHSPGKVYFENAGEVRYVYFFSGQLSSTLEKEGMPPTFILIKKKGVEGVDWYDEDDTVYADAKMEIPSNYHLIWEGDYVAVYQHG